MYLKQMAEAQSSFKKGTKYQNSEAYRGACRQFNKNHKPRGKLFFRISLREALKEVRKEVEVLEQFLAKEL